MPTRPHTACAQPGCPNATAGYYRCAFHRRARSRDVRSSAARRGYGSRHRQWRAVILAQDPICVVCERRKSVTADHIKPIDPDDPWGKPELWLIENGQGLCRICHNRKTKAEIHDVS